MKKVYIALIFTLYMVTGAIYSMDPAYKKVLRGKGGSQLMSITLIRAAGEGGLEVVKEMIEDMGVNIDYKNLANGNTALIEAVANKHPQIVDYLLKHGADVNITNNTGKSALDYAIANQDQAMVNKILGAAEEQG